MGLVRSQQRGIRLGLSPQGLLVCMLSEFLVLYPGPHLLKSAYKVPTRFLNTKEVLETSFPQQSPGWRQAP